MDRGETTAQALWRMTQCSQEDNITDDKFGNNKWDNEYIPSVMCE